MKTNKILHYQKIHLLQDTKINEMKQQILAMEVELTNVVKTQQENDVQISDTKVQPNVNHLNKYLRKL